MIKLVTILKGNDSLTRAEFERRWAEIHAPMAAKFPDLRGYMLSFSIAPGDPDAEGVAQLWFDSREGAQTSYASDVGRVGSADAIAYLGRRDHLLASERWLRDSASLADRPFKLMLGVKRAEGESRADFIDWWNAIDADTVAASTGADQIRLAMDEAGQLLNSGTAGNLGLRTGEAVYDGLLETWFPTRPAAEAGAARFDLSDLKKDLMARAARTEDFLLRETVIVRPPAPAFGGTGA
ncbi:EthD family reductase [Acuticoccus kandeliae]|uniref:EthD family reductase n=1 Tax=Acuticoccus kandeliae TaxID=2073160 RepID=UPI000D3E1DF5|nr:EthD family reductase [Acuticoccus kandeliae]